MNKRVLITGASGGIGRAVAKKFESEGYDIVCPDSDELNLLSLNSINDFVKKNRENPFFAIINVAGINEIDTIENITDKDIDNTMDINCLSPLRLLRGLVPAMKKQGYGRIVNISSIWGVVSKKGRVVYSVSKFAVHGITKTLAVELAEDNILVNSLCPGFTLTELTSKNNTPEEIAEISKDIPMGRMAEPEEIASAIYYLGSRENTYITGQILTVDGGFSSK